MEDRRRIEVVAAVIHDGGRILATQRGYGEFKDKWEFPGGKMEAGESREEALRREIREELDTEINIGKLLCTVEYDYPAFHLTMHCYLCSVVSGTLVLKEHESARWLPAEALESVDWLPADIQIIPIIRKCL
ncbi:mutator mutT protein [Alistipes sp. CAG:831]|nr:mutator mutT protein [Alistipes sp. CAG:831]